MKAKDRQLILESIFGKWDLIAMGCKRNMNIKDCPLCQEYYKQLSVGYDRKTRYDKQQCYGCPIKKSTGFPDCHRTLYWGFFNALNNKGKLDFIENEIDFLILLLDEKDQKNIEQLHIEWVKNR